MSAADRRQRRQQVEARGRRPRSRRGRGHAAPGVARGASGPATPRAARLLSGAAVTLMVAGPAAGLLIDDVYRDPAAIEARMRAYDLVTLAVAAPLLALCLRPGLRRSPRAQLVAAAVLAYTVYTYAFHVFEAAFND